MCPNNVTLLFYIMFAFRLEPERLGLSLWDYLLVALTPWLNMNDHKFVCLQVGTRVAWVVPLGLSPCRADSLAGHVTIYTRVFYTCFVFYIYYWCAGIYRHCMELCSASLPAWSRQALHVWSSALHAPLPFLGLALLCRRCFAGLPAWGRQA